MGVSWTLMGRDLEDITGLSQRVEVTGIPWVRQYTKYVGMGRMTMSKRAIIANSPHDGYRRTTSFDCGEMERVSEHQSSHKTKDCGRGGSEGNQGRGLRVFRESEKEMIESLNQEWIEKSLPPLPVKVRGLRMETYSA